MLLWHYLAAFQHICGAWYNVGTFTSVTITMSSIPPDAYGLNVSESPPQRMQVRKTRHILWLFAVLVVAVSIGAYLFVFRSGDTGDTLVDIEAMQDSGTRNVDVYFVYGQPGKGNSKAASGEVELVMTQNGLVLLDRHFTVSAADFAALSDSDNPPTVGWSYAVDPHHFDRTPSLGTITVNVAFTPHDGQKLSKSTTFNLRYRPN